MLCPKCGRENPDRNKFCNNCGTPLTVEPSHSQFLIPPPSPSPIARISTETAKDLKPLPDSFVQAKSNETSEKKVSGVEILQNGKAEPVSDNALANNKNGINSDELSPPLSPTAKTISQPKASRPVTKSAETFDDYLSEVENKYRATQIASQSYKKKHLILAASAIALITLGGIVVFTWYFMSQSITTTETPTENKTLIDEKASTGQTIQPPEMVYVGGGDFLMGRNDGDEYSRPARLVSVKPFYMDKTEVTCEEYKKFIEATGYSPPSAWQNHNFPPGAARKPVTGVTWDDANAFAKWKNKRLPTEEEWEFAARGRDGRIYPWGNAWKPEMANADKQETGVQEVGLSGGQSPFGAFDMSGNAWEWTGSNAKPYPGGKSFETNAADAKIIRGGFFGSSKEKATTVFRRAWGARSETDYDNTGFRCVMDVPVAQTSK
jgi:formylglycine-generating enzyme required for sulfatase activity